MIGAEAFGDSLSGETRDAETSASEGPCNKAFKVVTHDRGAAGGPQVVPAPGAESFLGWSAPGALRRKRNV